MRQATREIFNPFSNPPTVCDDDTSPVARAPMMRSQSFSIEDPDTCPKCHANLVDASIGGHGGVSVSNVKYCSSCRVVIPVSNL